MAIPPVGTLTSQDIGAPAMAGSTSRTGDVVTMTAGGADIWGASDQFRYAWQQRTGDFDISVRVESLTQPDLYAKAGLMARESLAANSRHVFAMVFPSNAARSNNNGGYEFQYRDATGGASAAIYPAVPQPLVNYPNTWLRLQRQGDTFIGYSSTDGVWWSEFARKTMVLPSTLYFGLAATAHTTAATTTAKIYLQSTRLQPWYYPSRTDCLACHNVASGGVLGPKTRQLNGNFLYPNNVTDNQLRSWAHIGLFNNAPQESQIPGFDALAALGDTTATLEKRARSYLDSNCSQCHRPGGVQAFWDARYDTPLAQQGLIYGALGNNLGDPTARVIVPQDLIRSILYQRVHTVGGIQMPPLARNMIDINGADVLAQWINSLPPNSPPTVTLTSPTPGSVFVQSDTVPLSATASDADGIAKVEFYDGTTKIGEDSAAPYQFNWAGAVRGVHQLTAVAIDQVGNSGSSASVAISVQGTPLPAPWAHDDIGTVGLPGDANYSANTFTVTGGGADIWNTADGFHFVYRSLTGDGELIARVASEQNVNGWTKAGVMMRETLDAGSRHAFSLVSPGNGTAFQRRVATNGDSTHTAGPNGTAPYWVRLVRAGDTFSAYASPNGSAWTLIGTDKIPMATTIYAGLAVSAHDDTALATAVFDNVAFNVPNPAFQARINFEPAGAAVPASYLQDNGAPFGSRGNGFSYGWSRDNSPDSRDRNSANAPDQRYDTLIHLQKAHTDGTTTSSWEMQVPNATYKVRVVSGDPDNFNDTVVLTIEGQTLINGTTTTTQRFLDSTGTFTVTDGRLTIATGTGAVNTKICFVEIASFDSVANQPPVVALTAPGANTTFLPTDPINLAATATDALGSIARVEFWVDGVKVGENTAAPYSRTWPGPHTVGPHSIRATAVDNVGFTVSSSPAIVQVMPLALLPAQMQRLTNPDRIAFTVRTTLPAGRTYVIEWSSDLITWTTLQSGTSSGTEMNVVDTTTGVDKRFYRLRVTN